MSRVMAKHWTSRILIVTTGVVTVGLVAFALAGFRVLGPSMAPALQDGEYIVVEKITYSQREPRRGEVIVFVDPHDREQIYIKRLIGTPGDMVQVVQGSLILNGNALAEPYLADSFLPEFSSQKMGPAQYFALGDNRARSKDSRNFGPIGRAAIIGRAWLVYSPPIAIRRAPHFVYPSASGTP